MKPPLFDYVAVSTVDAAVEALAAAGGEAKLIAGGQSLMPMLNFRLVRPSILVDINGVTGLAGIEEAAETIRVGALTRHHALETSPIVARHLPIVSYAMTYVAHLAIRNRGTIGGSLAHADPAAELPMLTMLLDAKLHIASPASKRVVDARAFFVDALTVDLAADEMITAIVLPKLPADTGWGFEEISRRHGDFAIATVGATLTLADGVIAQARLALTGVGPVPLRATEAEAQLKGRTLDDDLRARAIEAVRAVIEPETDLHASADYRRHLAGVLAGRALSSAWARATKVAA